MIHVSWYHTYDIYHAWCMKHDTASNDKQHSHEYTSDLSLRVNNDNTHMTQSPHLPYHSPSMQSIMVITMVMTQCVDYVVCDVDVYIYVVWTVRMARVVLMLSWCNYGRKNKITPSQHKRTEKSRNLEKGGNRSDTWHMHIPHMTHVAPVPFFLLVVCRPSLCRCPHLGSPVEAAPQQRTTRWWSGQDNSKQRTRGTRQTRQTRTRQRWEKMEDKNNVPYVLCAHPPPQQ